MYCISSVKIRYTSFDGTAICNAFNIYSLSIWIAGFVFLAQQVFIFIVFLPQLVISFSHSFYELLMRCKSKPLEYAQHSDWKESLGCAAASLQSHSARPDKHPVPGHHSFCLTCLWITTITTVNPENMTILLYLFISKI